MNIPPDWQEDRKLPAKDREYAEFRERSRRLREAYSMFLAKMPAGSIPVTLVLRQQIDTAIRHWRPEITCEQATSCVGRFIYGVERQVYKKLARPDAGLKRKRLARFFVREWGNDLGLHLHGAIEHPASKSRDEYLSLMTHHWTKLNDAFRLHFGDEASERWTEYTLKAKSGPLADNVDVENLYLH